MMHNGFILFTLAKQLWKKLFWNAKQILKKILGKKISSYLSQTIRRHHFSFFHPLVTVVMASYNHADYVEEAVRSILEQGIDSMQIIIVDDGSQDGTPDRIAKIQDKRIDLIRLKENREYHPRNLALSLAKGKYIAFQNSDDVWREKKLKKQLEILENNHQIAVCFTDVEIIGEDGKKKEGTWANGIFAKKNQSSIAWLRHFFDVGNCLCLLL